MAFMKLITQLHKVLQAPRHHNRAKGRRIPRPEPAAEFIDEIHVGEDARVDGGGFGFACAEEGHLEHLFGGEGEIG